MEKNSTRLKVLLSAAFALLAIEQSSSMRPQGPPIKLETVYPPGFVTNFETDITERLHAAIRSGNIYLVDALAALAASVAVDLNKGDRRGVTPLFEVVVSSPIFVVEGICKYMVDSLTRHGADVDAPSFGVDLLRTAIVRGLESAVDALAAHTKKINECDEYSTALIDAVKYGHTATEGANMVQSLIRYGADVNGIDREGNTPLHHAIISRKWEMIQLLISKGADPTLRNNNRQTPLDVAVMYLKRANDFLKDPRSVGYIRSSDREAPGKYENIIRFLQSHSGK